MRRRGECPFRTRQETGSDENLRFPPDRAQLSRGGSISVSLSHPTRRSSVLRFTSRLKSFFSIRRILIAHLSFQIEASSFTTLPIAARQSLAADRGTHRGDGRPLIAFGLPHCSPNRRAKPILCSVAAIIAMAQRSRRQRQRRLVRALYCFDARLADCCIGDDTCAREGRHPDCISI